MSSKHEQTPALPVNHWQSYLTLFRRNQQYRRLWLAGVISQFGNWFNYIAIFVLLEKLTGSGQAVSWFLIAKFLPTTIFGPAAGIIADRYNRKKIMIICDVLRVIIVLSFLFIKEADQVWLVYLLAICQETMWSFADPARRASVPNICRPEELNLANALGGATWSIMLALGAATGGLITHLWSWEIAIILDAITFLISALLLSGLKLPLPAAKEKTDTSIAEFLGLPDLQAGWQYVRENKRVARLLLVKSGWALSGGILVMLTIFGEQVLATPGQHGQSGILYSFRGIGAAIGPLLAWRLVGEKKQAMSYAMGLSFFVAGLSYLVFSQAPSLIIGAILICIGHMGGSVQWVFSTTLLQKEVSDQFRGRGFATEMAMLTLVLSISTWCTGAALVRGFDPRQVTMALALLFFLPGTIWLYLDRKDSVSSAITR